MLDRRLRQDKHPSHAAEIRENVIPCMSFWFARVTKKTVISVIVNLNHHSEMDRSPPIATLFLHEDLVARTLSFELNVKQWRLAEIEAGRGDPGRPNYLDAFSVINILRPSVQFWLISSMCQVPCTEHRWHSRGSAFLDIDGGRTYYASDCPGVHPPSNNAFPTIRTLLSIPFSLLHTLPRLSAIVPQSQYQHELITMGEEILLLWSWDPSPAVVEPLTILATRNNSCTVRTPQPIPIRDRTNITFDAMRVMPASLVILFAVDVTKVKCI